MLSKPNVKEILPRVGNRYQAVLAISKRARKIEADRLAKYNDHKEKIKEGKEDYSEYVFDAVDRAAKEITEGKVYVKINGEYAVTPEVELEKEIREAQEASKE